VSVTSQSAVIALKAIEMGDLRSDVESTLSDRGYLCHLESMSDSELMIKVSKGQRKTLMKIERLRHRPLEVVLEVDYSQADVKLNVSRPRQSNNSSMFSYRWIWLLIIFGGVFVTILGNISQAIANGFQQTGFTDGQIITFLIILAIVVPLSVMYGIPALQKQLNQGKSEFDRQLLEVVKTRVEQLHSELTATEVLRCWSCFKEIEFEDKVCPFCGENQK
jgi:hypothetical protein